MKLTEAQKQAMLNGASMEEVLAMEASTEDNAAATAAAEAALAAAATDGTPGAAADTATEDPTLETVQASLVTANATITDLEAKVATATEATATKDAEIAKLKADLAASQASAEALQVPLKAYAQKMSVALGEDAKDLEDKAGAALAQAHAALAEKFASTFKAGRQSASTTKPKGEPSKADYRMLAEASTIKF